MLSQGQRNHSGRRLPQVGSAASRGTASRPSCCWRPHPPLGPASRRALGRGPRGNPASLCGPGTSSLRPARVGIPRAPGIPRRSAVPRGLGLPNGESRMRAQCAGEGGREGRGECRARPAVEPRAHDACAGRERNHGLGWRLPAGERKPRTARARRKSGRRRARALP